MPQPARWTLPTLHREMQQRRAAKGDPAPVGFRAMRCHRCRAPHVPMDMLVDLRSLAADVREQLGVGAATEWICTGCLGTVHNVGRISHHELLIRLGAPAEALAWARAHAEEFPYPHGTWASADAYALAMGLEPPVTVAADSADTQAGQP